MSRHVDRRRAARYVVARRDALGLSQEALAKAAQVDPKTVWNLEAGDRWPLAKNRSKISAALEWDDDDLDRVAEGGYPITGPLPEDDPDGLAEVAGTDDFDVRVRQVIADLPEDQRSVVEELYESLLDAQRQKDRLFRKLLAFPRRGSGPPEEGGESAAR